MKKASKAPAKPAAAGLRSNPPVPALARTPGNDRAAFTVVGLGASAGGLEALEAFLKSVPPRSGMAFVVVQHLDPTHKGILVELLQRATEMPVVQVKDRQRVEANHVHVIPPNKDLSILHGVLHLLQPAAPRGLRLPIDFFLRSLADDQQDRAIAVILSGMGSDGTLGVRAIKEKGGGVFVQEPRSAKFDGMPRSAIETGVVDVVAPADQLPTRIIKYRSNLRVAPKNNAVLPTKEKGALEKIIVLLRAQTGHDFSHYKSATIYRRIERRMGLHQLHRIDDYVRYLRENPAETNLLFKELLIGVTSFFRDPAAWDQLRDEAIPALLSARPHAHVLRAWTVGCSTGEEAYSLAMIFKEALEGMKPRRAVSLQIFATDLDRDAIDKARQGLYPANIAADVSEQRLARFFVQDDRGYRVGKEIREMVIFATQNLVMDPPFTKLDVLTCRNLLIYVDPELQKKLVPLFHYSLNPGGLLMLGSSETVGAATELFTGLPGKTRLYRRSDDGRPHAELVEFPSAFSGNGVAAIGRMKAAAPANIQSLADRLILQRFAPAVVLTGTKGDIFYISGKTGRFLEPAAGQANWNIFAMARPGLGYSLNDAFNRSVRLRAPVTVHGVKVGTNGGTEIIDVTVQALDEPDALRGMVMVLFSEVTVPKGKKAGGKVDQAAARSGRLRKVTQELQEASEELQSTREEMQTSQHFSVFYPAENREKGTPDEELKVAAEEGHFEEEGWRVRKDGSRFWADAKITAVRDAAGRAIGFATVTRDLSERKAAERRLEVVESAPDGILLVDADGRIVHANPRAASLFGYSRDELIGRRYVELVPEHLWEEHAALRAAYATAPAVRTMGSLASSLLARRKDGTEFPVEISLGPQTGPDGKLVVAFVRDVTDLRRLQAEQARTLDRLARLQAVTAALAAAMTPDEAASVILSTGLAAVGTHSGAVARVVDGGRQLEHLQFRNEPLAEVSLMLHRVSRHAAELVEGRRRIPLEARTPPCDAARARAGVWLENPGAIEAAYPEFAPVLAHAGHRSLACLPLISRGEVVGVLGLDFTEARAFDAEERAFLTSVAQQCAHAMDRAQLFVDALEARDQAERATMMRDELLSVVAHDLGNPLNAIALRARQLSQMADGADGAWREVAASIAEVVSETTHLIEDLMDVAIIDSGQLRMRLGEEDARSIVERTVDLFLPACGEKGVSLIARAPTLPLRCDADRVKQALGNLVANALEHTPSGGTIRVTAEVSEGDVQVSVRDTGSGISEEGQEHIFDRYWRGKTRDLTKGVGLGLFIVKGIVTAHGGRVWVQSAIGRGSTFCFTLPLAPPSAR